MYLYYTVVVRSDVWPYMWFKIYIQKL